VDSNLLAKSKIETNAILAKLNQISTDNILPPKSDIIINTILAKLDRSNRHNANLHSKRKVGINIK